LFVPGTDHAGISAQTKFEKVLQTEKKIKRDTISDEKFIELLRE
jgi:valyl-tRNA synthetase